MNALRLLVCLVSIGLIGDGGAAQPPETSAPHRQGALSSAGSFYVEWWSEPHPIPLNEIFAVHFRVLDPEDHLRQLTGAVVTADAWMPEHNHGTTLRPQVVSRGDGTATARGFLLHMAGHWELRVGVAREGQMERVRFDVRLEP